MCAKLTEQGRGHVSALCVRTCPNRGHHHTHTGVRLPDDGGLPAPQQLFLPTLLAAFPAHAADGAAVPIDACRTAELWRAGGAGLHACSHRHAEQSIKTVTLSLYSACDPRCSPKKIINSTLNSNNNQFVLMVIVMLCASNCIRQIMLTRPRFRR